MTSLNSSPFPLTVALKVTLVHPNLASLSTVRMHVFYAYELPYVVITFSGQDRVTALDVIVTSPVTEKLLLLWKVIGMSRSSDLVKENGKLAEIKNGLFD